MAAASAVEGVPELPRIAGDALYYLIVKGDVVSDAFFIPVAPLRGFERIARGKNPEFVVEAVKRICGFCHASHGIASVEAFEDALGIYPPRDAHLVREVIGLLNRVQSHLLHAVLIVKDLLRPDVVESITRELFDVLEQVNGLLAKIGGAPTHPTNIVIGGVRRIPTPQLISHARDTIKEIRRRFENIHSTFRDEGLWSEKAHALSQVDPGSDVLATHPTYGNRYAVDLSKLRLVEYWAFRRVEEGTAPTISGLIKRATALIALYDGRVVEAGPRARAVRFGRVEGKGLMSIQLARMREVVDALERIENLLGEIIPEAPPRAREIVSRAGTGYGVYEAPRGTLIHQVELDSEGRVKSYRIVVPTQFNIPLMESKAIGLRAEHADAVPRMYDPCIPCATHYVRVR